MHPTIEYVNVSLPISSLSQQWHCEHWYFGIIPMHLYGGLSHRLTHKLGLVNKGVNNKLMPLFFLLTTFSHAGDSNEQK